MIENMASFEGRIAKIEGVSASGKTEVLVRRCAKLLERGVAPEKILVVTTSALAAQAFSHRLAARLDTRDKLVERLRVDSAFGICEQILSSPEAIAITGRVPHVLNKVEYDFFLEDIKTIGLPRQRTRSLLRFFYQQFSRLEKEESWLKGGDDSLLLKHMRSLLETFGGMLHEEVAPLAARYLLENKDAGKRAGWQYVFCDDFQNLSYAEQTAISLLATDQLIVTGNPNELASVETQFPNPEGFSVFETQRRNVEVFKLVRSFGAKCIVGIADALADRAGMSPAYRSASYMKREAQTLCIKWNTPNEEIAGLETMIVHDLESDQTLKPQDILILCTDKRWARSVGSVLHKRGLHCSLAGIGQQLSGDPRNSSHARALVAHVKLSLLANPQDMTAWRCWCGLDNALTNSDVFARLVDFAHKHDMTLLDALAHTATSADEPFLHARVLGNAWTTGQAFIAACSELRGFSIISAIGAEHLGVFDDLKSYIAGDESATELGTLERMLIAHPVFPNNTHLIRIATYENMAGLRARKIYAINCVDGLIPKRGAFEVVSTQKARDKILEHDRRLFASAVAKADDKLVISYFYKCPLEIAERAKVQVLRIRFEHGKRIALTRPCCYLEQAGKAVPGSISGQAHVAELAAAN